jgi:riboflavin biosynthesis pyrimidine reductase
MVASLDGATVVEGRSGGLSNPQDAAVLASLREAADVVIVGAATVREERHGPPRKAGQRIGVVTASGGVNAEGALLASGAGFLIMPEDGPPPPVGARGAIDTVRAGVGHVDLALALERLSDLVDAPTFVQCEGGPRLNGSLLDADCVDELDLTVSPVLAGGASPRVTAGATATLAGFGIAHLAVDDQAFVYTRWIRQR